MKKKFAFLVLFWCSVFMYAQNYTQAQEELRSDISSYLSRQGLNPENQSDGLKFKSEGSNYYIEIDKDEKSPMYLRLCRYVKYSDTIKQGTIAKNINSYNAKLGIKVCAKENGVVISSEMYLVSSSDFIDVFSTLLSQMKAAYKQIVNQ